VANHLAVTWEDEADARCALANGRWCDGTSLHTCQGGRYQGSSDCATDGAGCQEDGDCAICLRPGAAPRPIPGAVPQSGYSSVYCQKVVTVQGKGPYCTSIVSQLSPSQLISRGNTLS
jgi:hypothetical protein